MSEQEFLTQAAERMRKHDCTVNTRSLVRLSFGGYSVSSNETDTHKLPTCIVSHSRGWWGTSSISGDDFQEGAELL